MVLDIQVHIYLVDECFVSFVLCRRCAEEYRYLQRFVPEDCVAGNWMNVL